MRWKEKKEKERERERERNREREKEKGKGIFKVIQIYETNYCSCRWEIQ